MNRFLSEVSKSLLISKRSFDSRQIPGEKTCPAPYYETPSSSEQNETDEPQTRRAVTLVDSPVKYCSWMRQIRSGSLRRKFRAVRSDGRRSQSREPSRRSRSALPQTMLATETSGNLEKPAR